MTTATTDEAKVNLAASNGDAPKRRGRPPGSKNKTTTTATTPRARRTPKAAAPAKAATTTRATSPKVHAVLVSNEGIEVLHADGSTQQFLVGLAGAPLYDRRK